MLMSMFLCDYGLQRKTIEIRLICEQMQISGSRFNGGWCLRSNGHAAVKDEDTPQQYLNKTKRIC